MNARKKRLPWHKRIMQGPPILEDPLHAQRNPFQTFIMILALISSLPLLAGTAGSASLEKELADSTVIMWGLCLMMGSGLALLGEILSDEWLGLTVERSGLMLVGGAALIYAAVIVAAAGQFNDVRYAAGIQVAYGAACLLRTVQITRRMNWLRSFYDFLQTEEDDDATG